MMQELLNKLYFYGAQYGLNLVGAVLIFFIGKWGARLFSRLIEKIMIKANIEKTLSSFVRYIIYFGLLIVVIIAALNKLGVQTTSLIAIIGAAGLAVGLALQGSLANFAAGIMLILFKPFKVGDVIEAGGALGVVTEIQIFNTILNTPDNKRVIIPNNKVTGDKITNITGTDKRRVDMVFGISYTDDIKKAKEILEQVVNSNPLVLKDPPQTIAVSELADSSVNLVCRPWVRTEDYWNVYFDITEKGKIALEEGGMTIPFPQRDVHLYQERSQ
jgi:small conductance mechanosensitive channel